MADTLPQFAAKIGALGTAVGKIPESATGKAALAAKKLIQAQAPDHLRNVGRRKTVKLGVGYTVRSSGAAATALIAARGPWPIIEFDTPAHVIPKPRTRGAPRPIVIPGVGVRAYAHHPGTHGKHPFAKGAAAARVVAPKVYQTELALALTTIF